MAKILYEAAEEGGDVNPHHVETVLGVRKEEAKAFKVPDATLESQGTSQGASQGTPGTSTYTAPVGGKKSGTR